MFVRKKPNLSGSVSVQVSDKSSGYRVVKTIGTARDPQEVQRLVELGRLFIARHSGQFSLSRLMSVITPPFSISSRRLATPRSAR
ncbi:MAG: hypothetical protein R6V12_09750 [Candidatus Hydrogenedentota bacterium]